MEKEYLTNVEVSDLTGVPVATLRYWAHTGYGPRSALIGKHRRYKADEVRAWMDAQFEAKDEVTS